MCAWCSSRRLHGLLYDGLLDPDFLQSGGHHGDLRQVGQNALALWALDEGPQVWENVARDPAALVRHANDDVHVRIDDGHLDRRWRARGGRTLAELLLDETLHRVAKELADDVLEVAQDEWEVGVQMAREFDLREDDV